MVQVYIYALMFFSRYKSIDCDSFIGATMFPAGMDDWMSMFY